MVDYYTLSILQEFCSDSNGVGSNLRNLPWLLTTLVILRPDYSDHLMCTAEYGTSRERTCPKDMEFRTQGMKNTVNKSLTAHHFEYSQTLAQNRNVWTGYQ